MVFKEILIVLLVLIINRTDACPKGKLSCFDGANKVLGNIEVDQCSKWYLFFRCSPCSADEFEDVKILSYYHTYRVPKYKAFEKYLYQCRYIYPNTKTVYDDTFPFINHNAG